MSANNEKTIKYVGIFYIITILIYVAMSLHTWGADDDKYFSTALNNRGLIDFLNMRYHTWTGRILIEGIMVLTINHPAFFKISIAFAFLLMAISLCKLSGQGRSITVPSVCLAVTLLMFINSDVMSEAAWWVTGSYNYMQPIACGLASLAIFHFRPTSGYLLKLLSIIMICFSCFNEIFALLFVLPFILISVLSKRKYSKYVIIYSLTALATFIFSITAPGNRVRFNQETINWMPDFSNLNIIEKIALGYDRLSAHITQPNIIFFFLTSILIIVALRGKEKVTKTQALSIFILAFKCAIFFIYPLPSIVNKAFAHSAFLEFGNIANIKFFFPYAFSLLVTFSCLSLMMSLCRNFRDLINMPLIFILGILSVIIMGLSPTVYASNFRVVFIFDLSVVYIILYLFYSRVKF